MAIFSLDRRIVTPNIKPWGFKCVNWLPTDLTSLVLWLDASDASTITLDGSNKVEQWDDKSGNNNNVSQSSSSLRPTSEEISGMNFVKFNGVGDVLRRNLGAILSGDDPITVFCVVRVYGYGGGVAGGVVWGLGGDGAVARDTAFFCMETSSGTWIRLLGGNAQWKGTPLNTSKMFSLIYPGGGGVWRCYSEGAELTAISSVTGTHNWETNIDLCIGGSIPSRSDVSLNGSIGEVLIYTQSMSQIDRQKVEAYLAHKWGFEMGAVVGWLPSELASLELWLDATDISTITESSGSVSVWADKSGNGRDATQSSGSSQPTTGTRSIGGLNVLDFADDRLNISDQPITGTQSRSIFAVVQADSYGSTGGGFLALTSTNSGNGSTWDMCIESGAFWVRVYGNAFYEPAPVTSAAHLLSTIWETGQMLHAGTVVHHNGASLSLGGGSDQSINTYTADAVIGATPSQPDVYFDGLVGEVVIVGYAVSVADRQKIEGYLAHKWGLTANLPSDHPYKTEAP